MEPDVGNGGKLTSYGGAGSPSGMLGELPVRPRVLREEEKMPRGGKGWPADPDWYAYGLGPGWLGCDQTYPLGVYGAIP